MPSNIIFVLPSD